MGSRTGLLAVIILLTLIPTIDPSVAQTELHYVPDVPSEFSYLYRAGLPRGSEPGIWAALPYDSITLERSGCGGPICTTYKMTLHRGTSDLSGHAELHANVPGSASPNGATFPEKSGDFVGNVSILDYGRLNYLLVQQKFARLSSSYTQNSSDAQTVTLSTTAANTTKRVSDLGGVGPIELWAIQQAIDSIGRRIQWTPK